MSVQWEGSLGALSLEFEGTWQAEEFANLLLDLNSAYRLLTAVIYPAPNWRNEPGIQPSFPPPWFFAGEEPPDEVIEASLSITSHLLLGRIDYASPGIAEIIGSWNPLKIVADLVTNWRKENTERQRVENQNQQAREAAELHRAEIEARMKATVLEHLEKFPPSYREIAAIYVLAGPNRTARRIANDVRVGAVSARRLKRRT